jgi:urea transport system substrate-binding protein
MPPARRPDDPPADRTRLRPPAPESEFLHVPLTHTVSVRDLLSPPQGPGEMGRLGHFRVLRILGLGGMAVVFEAEDTRQQRPVALKVLRPFGRHDELARRRFLRESVLTAGLDEDHFVPSLWAGEINGLLCLALPLLHGETLQARLEREGRLPLADVLRIGRVVATALAAAHVRGLVHRDVKPANLWLEAEPPRVRLLDFGLARDLGAVDTLTQPGEWVGTPQYMSPEQIQGRPVDGRSDLFSLGCVLYQMATGQAPFAGRGLTDTLRVIVGEDPPPPWRLDPTLPRPVADLIVRLMAKDPHRRPPTASEVATELTRLQLDPTVPAVEATTAAPVAGGGRSRWFGLPFLALLIVGMEWHAREPAVSGAPAVAEGRSSEEGRKTKPEATERQRGAR